MYTDWEVHFRRAMTYAVHELESAGNKSLNHLFSTLTIWQATPPLRKNTQILKLWILPVNNGYIVQSQNVSVKIHPWPWSQALMCGWRALEQGYSFAWSAYHCKQTEHWQINLGMCSAVQCSTLCMWLLSCRHQQHFATIQHSGSFVSPLFHQ